MSTHYYAFVSRGHCLATSHYRDHMQRKWAGLIALPAGRGYLKLQSNKKCHCHCSTFSLSVDSREES